MKTVLITTTQVLLEEEFSLIEYKDDRNNTVQYLESKKSLVLGDKTYSVRSSTVYSTYSTVEAFLNEYEGVGYIDSVLTQDIQAVLEFAYEEFYSQTMTVSF